MKSEIAGRIRMARYERGLSQQNVADELDLKVATYSNIERGVTDITVSRLQQIARILKKDMIELLGLKENISEPPMVYQNTMTQQVLLLSNQLNAVQFKLGQLEEDFRKLEARLGDEA